MKHPYLKLAISACLLFVNTAEAKTIAMPDNEQLHRTAERACKSAVITVYPRANPRTSKCYLIEKTAHDALFGFIAYRADHGDLSEGKVEVKKVKNWHKAINLKPIDQP